jgi:excisionase family DNA binding protein
MKPKLAYSIREAAHATGLSTKTLRRIVAAGRLDVSRIGSRILILAASLQALLESGRREFISGKK